jgi:hypothetical protein
MRRRERLSQNCLRHKRIASLPSHRRSPVLTNGEPHQTIRVIDFRAQRSGGTTAFIARDGADSS